MNIGKRIKIVRNLRRMTQKQLGEKLEFNSASCDVRIAQYENGIRTPKGSIRSRLASILNINIKAINKPAFEKNEDIIHSLFMLEDVYHISLKREDDSAIGLVFDSSHPSYIDIREWLHMYRLFAEQKITKEEYDDWRYKYQSLA